MVSSLNSRAGPSEWLDAAAELVAAYERLRQEVTLVSDNRDQQDAVDLVSWDLGRFADGAVKLARSRNWSPAYAMGRPIQERAEHLVALGYDASFAMRFMGRSRLIEKTGRPPQGREGEARGIFRRSVADRTDDGAAELLTGLISLRDWGSMAVHATSVAPRFARGATDDSSEDDALYISVHITSMTLFALASIVLVAEPFDTRATIGPRGAIAETAAVLLETTSRWESNSET